MNQKEANLTSLGTWTWSKCCSCYCGLAQGGEAERWPLGVDQEQWDHLGSALITCSRGSGALFSGSTYCPAMNLLLLGVWVNLF